MLKIETGEKNKILRQIAKAIKKEEINSYLKLGKEMLKYIKNTENWGVWLAAPQVWYSIRMIVVSLLKDWEDENFKTVIMINPEILEISQDYNFESEWCLSVPGEKWEVKRANSIKLSYIDDKKSKKIIILNWLSARIVQHEIDHLNWKLFTDYLK